MPSPLLKALELKCNNTAYRPVMDAIDLLRRYLGQPLKEGAFFDAAETVPLDGVVPEQWRAAVVDDKGRVERIPYELCVLVPCGTRCAVGRSGWWARAGGVIRRTTCPPTSRTTGTSTTRPWASRRTRVSSSPP